MKYIASKFSATFSVSYIPDNFPGLIFKLRLENGPEGEDKEPNKERDRKKEKTPPKKGVTILLFSTGKGVITGAKIRQQISSAGEILEDLLNTMGILIKEKSTAIIQNIVASGDFHELINLELAALTLENTMYEPELFPGLIYRMQDPKTVFLLFQSGKFVCNGFTREEVAYNAAMKLRSILEDLEVLGGELDEEKE